VRPVPEQSLIPIFSGWNAWNVQAKNDLDWSALSSLPGFLGNTPAERLQIWVDNTVTRGSSAVSLRTLAGLGLVGEQVEVLSAPVEDLAVAVSRAQRGGPLQVMDGPTTLTGVRFFNRDSRDVQIAWPDWDDNFMIEEVFQPSPSNPVTSGPGSGTPFSQPSAVVAEFAGRASGVIEVIAVGVVVVLALQAYLHKRK